MEYTFDGATYGTNTTSFADVSGNGRELNYSRTISTSTNFPFAATDPELIGVDLSASITTASTYGAMQNASSVNLSLTNAFTFEGWINISNLSAGAALGMMRSTTGGTSSFGLGVRETGEVYGVYNSMAMSGGNQYLNTGSLLTTDTWYHLAYVYSLTSGLKIYLNATEIGQISTFSQMTLPTALDFLYVGGLTTGGSYFTRGLIDDVRLSDAALAPDQLGFYGSFTTVPEPGVSFLVLMGIALVAFPKRRRTNVV